MFESYETPARPVFRISSLPYPCLLNHPLSDRVWSALTGGLDVKFQLRTAREDVRGPGCRPPVDAKNRRGG